MRLDPVLRLPWGAGVFWYPDVFGQVNVAVAAIQCERIEAG